jgi:hypothetical protein
MSFPQAPESLTKPAEELQALDPNKKKLSDLLENANTNYGEYHKLKQQNDAWIEWYK